MALELRGPKGQSLTENPVSLAHGKYDDARMPWVGRAPSRDRNPTVTDVSVRIVDINENRVWLSIQNLSSANNVYLALGETAIVPASGNGTALFVGPLGSIVFDRSMPWADYIEAICDAGVTARILINEVSQNVQQGRGE